MSKQHSIVTLSLLVLLATSAPGQADVLDNLGGGDSCPDEDQSGGTGGQSLDCDFECPSEPGNLHAEIDADDSSAGVSVTALCETTTMLEAGGEGAVDKAHCSGKNKCEDNKPRSVGGVPGSCKGDSDEWTDNGLFIHCSASITPNSLPGTGGQPGGQECIISEPIQVCTLQCEFEPRICGLMERIPAILDGTNSASMYSGPDGDFGIVCKGRTCVPVTPVCERTITALGFHRTCII